jgi:hypothetical protein
MSNPDTRGLITAAHLALMKPDAILVNTSRAELIAPGALVAALKAGRPGFAAVDVYEEEPVLGAAHPLLALENALCTPHLGYVERDSYALYFGQAFDNLLAWWWCVATRPYPRATPEALLSYYAYLRNRITDHDLAHPFCPAPLRHGRLRRRARPERAAQPVAVDLPASSGSRRARPMGGQRRRPAQPGAAPEQPDCL